MPESINGIDVSYACYWHDLGYGFKPYTSRGEEDLISGANIHTLLVPGGMSHGLAMNWAAIYYMAVRTFGEEAYEERGDSD